MRARDNIFNVRIPFKLNEVKNKTDGKTDKTVSQVLSGGWC
jgi:hypothetical protein